MNFLTQCHLLRTLARRLNVWTVLFTLSALGACGGGADTSTDSPISALQCDVANPATFSECGTLMVSLTDADGDFLNYTVDVLSLTLETANGRIVETMPRSARINFTDYVDLSELVTIATIPPASYVSGTIRLDYGDAEVLVEADGMAKETIVTDSSGATLTQTELKISLSNSDPLRITKGRPAFLQLDFDLAASHSVDIVPTPAVAVSEQFIVAEVSPVDQKDIRVRGPLLDVSADNMTYTVALRPFHHRDGDFGRAVVHVTNASEFEVNGEMFAGAEGLRALSAAGNGTITVAKGVLNIAAHEFTADLVLAGSSVPGDGRDAVVGNIIKRDGNLLTIRGATIIPSDRRAHFHDDVLVEIGPNTKVFKDGDRVSDLSIDALSIGQRVTLHGNQPTATTDSLAPQILFDATAGAVRMHITQISGIVNTVVPGQTDITLHAIDRRRVQIFDFTGTGASADLDADPSNYEVASGNLALADFAAGKPIVARGFPTSFGIAPPDFSGHTIIDYTSVRSALGVGWGAAGTVAPFINVAADGLILDNQNPDIDQRHHIKQGPVLIDLTALDSSIRIQPRTNGRSLYYLKSQDSLRLYSDFDNFANDLSMSLDGATAARSMHARGQYDAATNVFTAYKIGVYLLEL